MLEIIDDSLGIDWGDVADAGRIVAKVGGGVVNAVVPGAGGTVTDLATSGINTLQGKKPAPKKDEPKKDDKDKKPTAATAPQKWPIWAKPALAIGVVAGVGLLLFRTFKKGKR